jgi:hypothetical protein
MKKSTKFRFKVISLVGAMLVLATSAIPLFNRDNDAMLLAVIFGAFAAGAMLRDVVHEFKEKRKDKVTE